MCRGLGIDGVVRSKASRSVADASVPSSAKYSQGNQDNQGMYVLKLWSIVVYVRKAHGTYDLHQKGLPQHSTPDLTCNQGGISILDAHHGASRLVQAGVHHRTRSSDT